MLFYLEWKSTFAMFDTDDSGSVDVSELAQVMTSLGQTATQQELADMIKEVDLDSK